MNPIACSLPGGYADDSGVIHLHAEVIPFTGQVEELLSSAEKAVTAVLVTQILSRCVRRIGNITPVTEEIARSLLVGDRQYLLLKLREVTFGDIVQSTVNCPWSDCGQKIDIDFSLTNIPVKTSTFKGPIYTAELSPEAAFIDEQGDQHRKIKFRLPNGGDQEALSSLIVTNEALALTKLLERCIKKIGSFENPEKDLISRLSSKARMEIEKQMDKVAPKVELTLGADCPECERQLTLPFALQDFFFGELSISQELLYREVHYLASHYHWSEREIMQMTRNKRRKYIEVLADEIERLNNAVA
jgi:hypothetical protein